MQFSSLAGHVTPTMTTIMLLSSTCILCEIMSYCKFEVKICVHVLSVRDICGLTLSPLSF